MGSNNAAQAAMQKFGRFLSGMVMPNIGAFIAWGFITALFIPTGWMPNEYLSQLVGPMAKWLIPLLIGYSGGAAVNGQRGGVMGAIATAGIITGSDIPMFLGAMIMGPLGGYVIKKFDENVQDSIPQGFEMLVNNFSIGIIGGILAILAFVGVGPVVSGANEALRGAVEGVVAAGLLPLASIIIEPAKVLFLNNALNHGVLSPLGIQQAEQFGKSVFFLLEANPGPGFGILLAYWLFGKGMAKSSSPGAMIIHVLGGIHEIYFPYILMKPILIIAAIAGGMSGVFTLTMLDGGLIAPSSPGSIIAITAMTPSGSALFANMSAFIVATAVSCVVASIFIKASKDVDEEGDLEAARDSMASMKSQSKGESVTATKIAGKDLNFIVYACDAGMGSSALGAAALRKKLKNAGYDSIKVINTAIGNIPKDAQIVVSHEKLTDRAVKDAPQAEHISVKDFIQNNVFDIIEARLQGTGVNTSDSATAGDIVKTVAEGVLLRDNVKVGLKADKQEEAIRLAGELLYKSGYVGENYIEGMLNREQEISTYIGKGIAIPHGESAVKDSIKKTGIVVLQYPEGVKFGGETAHIVIGIAGAGDDHLTILANIATMVGEYSDEDMEKLFKTNNSEELFAVFTKVD